MSDYGHDPTGAFSLTEFSRVADFSAETAVPYSAFKKAGFEVQFATENGKTPECDQKMLKGITQKLLVRSRPIVPSPSTQPNRRDAGREQIRSPSLQHHVPNSRIHKPPLLVLRILLPRLLQPSLPPWRPREERATTHRFVDHA